MDILQSMRFFVAVAQCGSFTAAAQLLDSSTTTVSKVISSLEDRLHTRLINRTTRRLALTEAGVRYLNTGAWTEKPVCYIDVDDESVTLRRFEEAEGKGL